MYSSRFPREPLADPFKNTLYPSVDMMFSIRYESENRWSVTDQNDETVFKGSLPECEDWLDHHENQSRRQEANGSRLMRFVRKLLQPFGK